MYLNGKLIGPLTRKPISPPERGGDDGSNDGVMKSTSHKALGLQCDQCTRTFDNDDLLKKHIRRVHIGPRWKCHLCEYTCDYSDRPGLRKHLQLEHRFSKEEANDAIFLPQTRLDDPKHGGDSRKDTSPQLAKRDGSQSPQRRRDLSADRSSPTRSPRRAGDKDWSPQRSPRGANWGEHSPKSPRPRRDWSSPGRPSRRKRHGTSPSWRDRSSGQWDSNSRSPRGRDSPSDDRRMDRSPRRRSSPGSGRRARSHSPRRRPSPGRRHQSPSSRLGKRELSPRPFVPPKIALRREGSPMFAKREHDIKFEKNMRRAGKRDHSPKDKNIKGENDVKRESRKDSPTKDQRPISPPQSANNDKPQAVWKRIGRRVSTTSYSLEVELLGEEADLPRLSPPSSPLPGGQQERKPLLSTPPVQASPKPLLSIVTVPQDRKPLLSTPPHSSPASRQMHHLNTINTQVRALLSHNQRMPLLTTPTAFPNQQTHFIGLKNSHDGRGVISGRDHNRMGVAGSFKTKQVSMEQVNKNDRENTEIRTCQSEKESESLSQRDTRALQNKDEGKYISKSPDSSNEKTSSKRRSTDARKLNDDAVSEKQNSFKESDDFRHVSRSQSRSPVDKQSADRGQRSTSSDSYSGEKEGSLKPRIPSSPESPEAKKACIFPNIAKTAGGLSVVWTGRFPPGQSPVQLAVPQPVIERTYTKEKSGDTLVREVFTFQPPQHWATFLDSNFQVVLPSDDISTTGSQHRKSQTAAKIRRSRKNLTKSISNSDTPLKGDTKMNDERTGEQMDSNKPSCDHELKNLPQNTTSHLSKEHNEHKEKAENLLGNTEDSADHSLNEVKPQRRKIHRSTKRPTSDCDIDNDKPKCQENGEKKPWKKLRIKQKQLGNTEKSNEEKKQQNIKTQKIDGRQRKHSVSGDNSTDKSRKLETSSVHVLSMDESARSPLIGSWDSIVPIIPAEPDLSHDTSQVRQPSRDDNVSPGDVNHNKRKAYHQQEHDTGHESDSIQIRANCDDDIFC